MKVETGEIITLSNNKEYICFSNVTLEGKDYLYLMSNFKPVEIKFAEQTIENGQIQIRIINNNTEKQKLLTLFKNSNQ